MRFNTKITGKAANTNTSVLVKELTVLDTPYNCIDIFNTYVVDATDGDIKIFVKDIGRPIDIILKTAGGNTLRIYPTIEISGTIDGASYITLDSSYSGATVYPVGNNTYYTNLYKATGGGGGGGTGNSYFPGGWG
jgi:hypothetical protein